MNNSKSPIDSLLDNVEWEQVNVEPINSDMPYVTHKGVLCLGEISIVVLVLSTGQRIIPIEEMRRIFT